MALFAIFLKKNVGKSKIFRVLNHFRRMFQLTDLSEKLEVFFFSRNQATGIAIANFSFSFVCGRLSSAWKHSSLFISSENIFQPTEINKQKYRYQINGGTVFPVLSNIHAGCINFASIYVNRCTSWTLRNTLPPSNISCSSVQDC